MKGQLGTGELPLMTDTLVGERNQGFARPKSCKGTGCEGKETYRRAMVSSFHGDSYFNIRGMDSSFCDDDFSMPKSSLRLNKAKKETLSFFDGDPYALVEVPTSASNREPFSSFSVEANKHGSKNYNNLKSSDFFTDIRQINYCSDDGSLSGACDSSLCPLGDELEVCDLPQNVFTRKIKPEIFKKGEILNIDKNQKKGFKLKSAGNSTGFPFTLDFGALSPLLLSDSSASGSIASEIMPQIYPMTWNDSPSRCSSTVDRPSSSLLEERNGQCEAATLTNTEEECQCRRYYPNELGVKPRSLSQKYRPKVFEELIGQDLSIRSLSGAIHKREELASMYLFGGSRGTGKTSAARIFATALNCFADQKPCGICITSKSPYITEIDAASHNGVEMVKALIRDGSPSTCDRFKVFIVDECHMLTNETWNALLKLLKRPRRKIVFILTTTDPEQVPINALRRCQIVTFQKINDFEIVQRLRNLAELESLDVDPGVLDLIAWRSDGSLRDAEILLDQLSLLGERITLSTVHALFGSVSKEKLLGLLAFALCSDTIHTVQSARELIDSGVEPLDLVSQLGTVMRDILSGSSQQMTQKQKDGGCFSDSSKSSKEHLERLRLALQILSETEKQLKESSYDRTTWLTAALLQFGPAHPSLLSISSPDTNLSGNPKEKPYLDECREILIKSKKKHVELTSTNGDMKPMQHSEKKRRHKSQIHPDKMVASSTSLLSTDPLHEGKQLDFSYPSKVRCAIVGRGNLQGIWQEVLKNDQLLSIKQLLQKYGSLSAVSITPGNATAVLEFQDPEFKSKSEKHRNSISRAFEMILGLPVEVKMSIDAEIKECGQKYCEFQLFEGRNKLKKVESVKEMPIFPYISPMHVSSRWNSFQRTESEMQSIAGAWNTKNKASELSESTQKSSSFDDHTKTLGEKHTSHGCISMECCNKDQFYNLEAENLMLEPQSKYGGVLCWMSPEVDDDKVFVQHTQKGCGLLTRMVRCTK